MTASLAAARLEQVQALQGRIRHLQKRGLDERILPTLPGLADLLPGGGLKTGAAYSIGDSHALVMALLTGPSRAGSWCGVVGLPDFGAEAAVEFGIDPGRLVLVPRPGRHWLAVTAALADVLPVVVTRPATAVSDTDAARLAARLRQRGCTLLAMGPWPQSEARLGIASSAWSGLGSGYGYLTRREVEITVITGYGRPRRGRLVLPPQGIVPTVPAQISSAAPLQAVG